MSLCFSYSAWATSKVFCALKPNRRFACRCNSVRSYRRGGAARCVVELMDSTDALPESARSTIVRASTPSTGRRVSSGFERNHTPRYFSFETTEANVA